MQSPKVSVVMPVFRCNPELLTVSIESILRQTVSELELVVVVDPSEPAFDDAMSCVLGEFKDDKRLRVMRSISRRGFVESLNVGIVASRGEYIARMDGDDVSLPQRLERQIHVIEDGKADFVGSWAKIFNDQGQVVGQLTPPADAETIRRILMVHNPFVHGSVMFRRSIIDRVGLYNRSLQGAEDYELWMRIISQGFVCVNLQEFLLNIRETADSIMRGKGWRRSRLSYSMVKLHGITRYGYHDPLSILSCLASPFSLLITPKMSTHTKSLVGWLRLFPH